MARMSQEEMERKKTYAKLLYTTTDDSQKEIALRVGVTEKTIGDWIVKGLWESLKTSLLTSKSEQLRRLYETLSATIDKMNSTPGGIGDTKLADVISKLTASIKNLETETSAGQMFETGTRFINKVLKENKDDAVLITKYFDSFILEELNNKF